MLNRFKAWLKSRSATTPCEVWAGDTIILHLDSEITGEAKTAEGNYETFHFHQRYDFEFEVTRPYRTKDDCIRECMKHIDINVQRTQVRKYV